jgi:hypothetical protein
LSFAVIHHDSHDTYMTPTKFEIPTASLGFSSAPATASQSNILRRHLHPAFAEVGFEKAGTMGFAASVTRSLEPPNSPNGVLDFWLGWSSAEMSGHYDAIRLLFL